VHIVSTHNQFLNLFQARNLLDLQEQGAPVDGIGIQGHINSPIRPIVCSPLDKLGILGLPIWFTELDSFFYE
jgi:GH35 family endo-1,4-beta-xylanase